MKKILLALVVTLSFGSAVAKSTIVETYTPFELTKSTTGLNLLKSKQPIEIKLCNSDNPNSGCFTGWLGGCFYSSGMVVYCILK
ncbi:MAG: hypothetical protein JKX98_01935 [Alcanivoracaceae bacterium]|nr:hypothetical protein [Alcanivoracaceae bacterium]